MTVIVYVIKKKGFIKIIEIYFEGILIESKKGVEIKLKFEREKKLF